jgi:hypothetical protein
MQHGEVPNGSNSMLGGADRTRHSLLPMPESGLPNQVFGSALVHHQASKVCTIASRGLHCGQIAGLEGNGFAS